MQSQSTPCPFCSAAPRADGLIACRPRCYGSRSLPMPQRAWGRIDRSGAGCWEWTGRRNADGYGKLGVNGRDERAHRLAWELTYGPIPPGLHICHHCDNPPYCRPDHLFLGTNADNLADMARKGRGGSITHPERLARGDRSGARLHPDKLPRGDAHYARAQPHRLARGERVKGARLTPDLVRQMRAEYATNPTTYTALAKRYDITRRAAFMIVTRLSWKHVA